MTDVPVKTVRNSSWSLYSECKGLFEVCGICKFKGNIFLGKL